MLSASLSPVQDSGDTSSDDGDVFHSPLSMDDRERQSSSFTSPAQNFQPLKREEVPNGHVQQDATSLQNGKLPFMGHGLTADYVAARGLRLSYLHDSNDTASPKVLLTEPEFDPFAAAFSEDLLRSECDSPGHAISPSSSSTSTLFSPEQPTLSVVEEKRPKLTRACVSEFMPTTAARAYSPRFPAGHALCSAFVNKYELDGELGSGGYGFVMAARNRYDGVDVAVKFITKDKIPSHAWALDDAGNEVPLEAKLLAVVDHHGIVKFHDLYDDNLYFYLVQELHGTPWLKKLMIDKGGKGMMATSTPPVQQTHILASSKAPKQLRAIEADGRLKVDSATLIPRPSAVRRTSHDLFECLEQSKNKRFPEKDAKYIFGQVVDVVDYLDRHGITHCDIKDENVVVDKNLRIKVIDFGSVVVADPTRPRPLYTRFFGTTAYASPEIVLKHRYRAPPAEIWSLGVLLSYLLTGMSPFITESDKLAGRIMLDSGANVSRTCMHLLTRCLETDPKQRADITEVRTHPWLEGAFPVNR